MESMETDDDIFVAIQANVKKVAEPQISNGDTEDLLANLEEALSTLENSVSFSEANQLMLICGIELWNVAIGKSADRPSSVTSARMRQSGLFMVRSACPENNTHPSLLKMALSTAKSWIECENYEMAEKALNMATEILKQEPETSDPSEEFAIFLHLALCNFKNGDSETANDYVKKAKSCANTTGAKRHLALLCYNFGVESCNCGFRTDSATWLETSFQLGKEDDCVDNAQRAKALRLWATNLMHLGGKENLKKAVEVVDMANKEDISANGCLLKIKILLCLPEMDGPALYSVTQQLAGTPDLTMDQALTAVSLLQLKKLYDPCDNLLGKILSRFSSSPADRDRLSTRRAEILLETKRTVEAEKIIRKLINGIESMEDTVVCELKGLCWKTGRSLMEGDVCAALMWLDMALPLFKDMDVDKAFNSEFLRLKAVCLMEIGNLEQALETAKLAETYSPEDSSVLLLMFKLALLSDNKEIAKDYCQKMLESSPDSSSDSSPGDEGQNNSEFIVAAAKVALETNKDVAIECLEQYLANVQEPEMSVTILKCLVRLRISVEVTSSEEKKSLINYFKTAADVLEDQTGEDAQWFMKVAWNLALQHGDDPNLAYDFYAACLRLSKLCGNGRASLVQQKRCLLLAAASAIECAKIESVDFTKRQTLYQCLEHIKSCRNLCQELSVQDSAARDISTPVLLMLYEFEVGLAMNDPQVEKVLESAISLPQTEPKTFEILADLVMEYRPSMSALAARSLKIAIKKQLQQPEVDFNKCSKTFHSLIELALRDRTCYEQAWGYYMDVLDVLDNMAQAGYPELEVLWLLTKAWNCGIQQYREMKYTNVLDWLRVALRLVSHLTTFKTDYDEKLKNLYQQVKHSLENATQDNDDEVRLGI